MQRFLVLFGSSHLQDYDVDPHKVLLVVRGETSYKALLNYFGHGFVEKFSSVMRYDLKDNLQKQHDLIEYTPQQLEDKKHAISTEWRWISRVPTILEE